MKRVRILTISAALMLVGGCAPQGVGFTGYADVGYPSMAYVDGTWVVLGQDYPLFYDSGFYWRWSNDAWLRSPYYDRDFVRVAPRLVPGNVRRIDRPRRYTYYRPRAGVQIYRAPTHDRRYYDRRYYDQRYDRRSYDRRNDRRYYDQRYYDRNRYDSPRRYYDRSYERTQRRPPPRTSPRTPRAAPPRAAPPPTRSRPSRPPPR